MRLFLDANILFLAGYSPTSPVHDLLALAHAGRCELVTSRFALEEARRNLLAKGPPNAVVALDAAIEVIACVPEAAPAARAQAAGAALTDPDDVPILAAAIQCRAAVLVTGDRRAFGRLFRTSFGNVEILRLRDALHRILGLPLGD